MFKKKNNDMLVEEPQYRAVITFDPIKRMYKASVQRRTGVSEWERVRCGLKGQTFESKEQAEMIARHKIKLQKALDNDLRNAVSYIIYDD